MGVMYYHGYKLLLKVNPMYMDSYTDITQCYAHDRTITKIDIKVSFVLYNVVYV